MIPQLLADPLRDSWHLRSLHGFVSRSQSFARDPTPHLLSPTVGHHVRPIEIPLGDHALPGYDFTLMGSPPAVAATTEWFRRWL